MREYDKHEFLLTLEAIELHFAVHFGTYGKDDTVKISEVFDVLKEIKEIVEETAE